MSDDKLLRLEALRALLRERGVDTRERAAYLASRCGSSVSYWSGLLGGHRAFGEKVARSLEHHLGLPRGHLDNGAPNMGVSGFTGVGEAAVSREVFRPFTMPQTISWEFVMSKTPLPELFALAMPDDAMSPGVDRGTLLLFDTKAQPKPGKGVLVEDASGVRYVRRYVEWRAGEWRAQASNDLYVSLDSVNDRLRILAVMTGRMSGDV